MKKSKGKILALVLPLIFTLLLGLFFLLKSQNKAYQLKVPASSALVFKLQHPLEFAENYGTIYEWAENENFGKHKQQVLRYFQKGLKSSDYTVNDLLGNKQVYYILSAELKTCVAMPLNKNDHFFMDAVLKFFESTPIGLTNEGQNYYSISGEVKTYFKIDKHYLILGSDKKDIENLISKQKDSTSLSFDTEHDELRINQKALKKYFGTNNTFSSNNIYLNYFKNTFCFKNIGKTYAHEKLTESILNILDHQKTIKKKLSVPRSKHSIYISISNGLQFKEDLMSYSKSESLNLESKQANFEKLHNINILEFYQNIQGIVNSHDLNPSGNKLLRIIKIPVDQNYSPSTDKLIFEKTNKNDTLWHTENFDLNQLLFGHILPSNPLTYFSIRKGEIILYENIEAFDACHKTKTKQIEIINTYEEHLLPNSLIRIFNRTIQKSSPIGSFLKRVEKLKTSYSGKDLKLNIKFATQKDKQLIKLKKVYDFEQDFSSTILLTIPYKSNPYIITKENNLLSVWNDKKEQILETKVRGKLLSATRKNNTITVFTEYDYLQIENLKLIKQTKFKNKIFYISDNQEEIITQDILNYNLYNSKGRKKREFKTNDTLHKILNSDGLFYTTKDTSFRVLNSKGKFLKEHFTEMTNEIVKCFQYKNTYYTINNLGEISPIDSKHTSAQLLGDIHLLKNPFEIIESSSSGIQFYSNDFYKTQFFKQLLSSNLNIAKVKKHYLIHDLDKNQAIIISASGKVVIDEFKLSPRGQVILQGNKLFRLDNFGKSYQLDYMRL